MPYNSDKFIGHHPTLRNDKKAGQKLGHLYNSRTLTRARITRVSLSSHS